MEIHIFEEATYKGGDSYLLKERDIEELAERAGVSPRVFWKTHIYFREIFSKAYTGKNFEKFNLADHVIKYLKEIKDILNEEKGEIK